jgi:hypothetical protein
MRKLVKKNLLHTQYYLVLEFILTIGNPAGQEESRHGWTENSPRKLREKYSPQGLGTSPPVRTEKKSAYQEKWTVLSKALKGLSHQFESD